MVPCSTNICCSLIQIGSCPVTHILCLVCMKCTTRPHSLQVHSSMHSLQVHSSTHSLLVRSKQTWQMGYRTGSRLDWIELNSVWVWALPGLLHLGLKTSPLYPMFCTKLEEPCFFSKFPGSPYNYFPNILRVQKEGAQICMSEWS